MNKTIKVLLGIVTLWPIVYMVIFFVFMVLQVFSLSSGAIAGEPSPDLFLDRFFLIMALHLFTMIWIFTLLIIYIVNVFTNDRVEKDKKALWAVAIFLGGMLAMPVYWYLYIWRKPRDTNTSTTPSTS